MKKAGQFAVYLLFRFIVILFAPIPFRWLHFKADAIGFLFFHGIGYRKKVVLQNLRNSFPEKSQKEILNIAKKFYRHLGDIIIESIKGFSMSKKQFRQRHKLLKNPETDELFESNKNIMMVLAHYNNWEWGNMSGALQLNSDVMILYKPLSNPFLDKYMKKGRERFGTELIPIENIARAFNKKKGGKFYSILVADQSPGNARGAVWLNFLNQDTATLRGPEVLARKYDMPVVYLNIQKKKRGYYEIIPQLITKNPKETSEHEITKRFMKMLEKNICEHPEYWLWSHRRWKKKRKNPEYE